MTSLRTLSGRNGSMARYSTSSDLVLLKKYASLAQHGIVEIGVLEGETTREMGSVAHVPIYGIDPIIPDSMVNTLIGNSDTILKNMSFYKDFHFFKDYSYNVVKTWKAKFDFIWIDGDHTYKGVKRDFDEWFPLLENQGYLALHDVFPNVEGFQGYPGPLQLFNEIKSMQGLKLIEICNTMPIFQKI